MSLAVDWRGPSDTRHVRPEEELGELVLDVVVRELGVSMADPGFGEAAYFVAHSGRKPQALRGLDCPQSFEPSRVRLRRSIERATHSRHSTARHAERGFGMV
jgi:hypothetical protein